MFQIYKFTSLSPFSQNESFSFSPLYWLFLTSDRCYIKHLKTNQLSNGTKSWEKYFLSNSFKCLDGLRLLHCNLNCRQPNLILGFLQFCQWNIKDYTKLHFLQSNKSFLVGMLSCTCYAINNIGVHVGFSVLFTGFTNYQPANIIFQ